MDFSWKTEYHELASKFLKKHFGSPQGITRCFPCMRDDYPWGKHRPSVADSRIPAKNNTEYHGLESHASQYHATGQYDYAYEHWLLAASWRVQDMKANRFCDSSHNKAVEYCLQQAMYNKALDEWQGDPHHNILPCPTEFKLSIHDIEKKEEAALKLIDEYHGKAKT
ncbi:hypothetical protein JG631_17580 [Vibrio cholerae]|uniref:hypothetical protein n=1 Tax=Vibrio cholerae TaxID=666 RepID=UPI0018F06353|nr:hypothetical protein [Vibrio cholerae]MBJ6926690.1 hypothetical protein [Vibrio cholerae]